MPTLIALMPVGPVCLPVVHAAQTAGWKIIKTAGGRLEPNAIGGDVAMYGIAHGASTSLHGIARMNRLSLVTMHDEWHTSLPSEMIVPTASDSQDATMVLEYEFRCFVNEGMVAAVSPFRHRGSSCKTRAGWQAPEELCEDAVRFCEGVLADERVESPPAFAMDVGLLLGETEEEHRWFVCGSAAAWQAEIFGCSPSAILPVLLRACRSPGQVNLDDQPWLAS